MHPTRWSPAHGGAATLVAMGFLEYVEVDVAADEARATVHTDERAENASGGVHGGLIATLVDAAMGRAVRATVDEDEVAVVTVQMSVTYLNGAKPGDTLVATGTVLKRAKSLAIVEAEVTCEGEDEPIARAQATFALTSKD